MSSTFTGMAEFAIVGAVENLNNTNRSKWFRAVVALLLVVTIWGSFPDSLTKRPSLRIDVNSLPDMGDEVYISAQMQFRINGLREDQARELPRHVVIGDNITVTARHYRCCLVPVKLKTALVPTEVARPGDAIPVKGYGLYAVIIFADGADYKPIGAVYFFTSRADNFKTVWDDTFGSEKLPPGNSSSDGLRQVSLFGEATRPLFSLQWSYETTARRSGAPSRSGSDQN